MTSIQSLVRADRVYRSVAGAKIIQHPVNENLVQRFAQLLREFEREAGAAATHDVWRTVLIRLKRYRFNLAATPVPSNLPGIQPEGLLSSLEKRVQDCPLTYPSLESMALDLMDVVTKLFTEAHSPLGNALISHLRAQRGTEFVVLLKERRHVSITEKVLRETISAEDIDHVDISGLSPRDLAH